jgi:hypothetical protein
MDYPIFQQANHPIRFEDVGFGSIVTSNTMTLMRNIINASVRSYYVRRWAEKITEYADDDYSRAEAIFNFIVSNSRYVPDPVGLELLKSPEVSLQLIEVGNQPAMDCDDSAILMGALMMAVGIPYALRAVSFNEEYSHIYGLVKIKDRGWIPIDFVVGKKGGEFGDEPEGIVAIKDMEV